MTPEPELRGVIRHMRWELSKSGFNGQNRSKINAIAMDATGQRYGPVRALSTAATLRPIHHFDTLFAFPRPLDWASVRPARAAPASTYGFCVTTSFPVTKTGLRFGLATALV